MRLLSRRLPLLQLQSRAASRYSNPSRPASTAAPTEASYFRSPAGYSSTVPPAGINPLDVNALREAAAEKRRYHLHRMRFAGIGLILSLLMTGAVVWNLDLERMGKGNGRVKLDAGQEAEERFQGKEVKVIGRGEGKKIVAVQPPADEVELVETGTSSVPHFPKTLCLPAGQGEEQYTLLGLGIRTVSFLSIQVYVVGMYIRTSDLSALQATLIHHVNASASTLIPSEQDSLRQQLLDPTQSLALWSEILSQSPEIHTAWRVVPTRNTDFAHLRDGWVTGIGKRTAEARQRAARDSVGKEEKLASEYEAEDFGVAMRGFMNLFAGGKAPKGSIMLLARGDRGQLDVWFQGKAEETKLLGSVTDERISRLIWLNYLGGEKVSSEAARKGVVEGCVGFAGRPMGSADTMVT